MRNKQAEQTVSKLLDKFEEIRKEKGLSHEKLAEMAGLNRSTVSLLESKKRTPTILTCLKICTALDIKLDAMLKEIGES